MLSRPLCRAFINRGDGWDGEATGCHERITLTGVADTDICPVHLRRPRADGRSANKRHLYVVEGIGCASGSRRASLKHVAEEGLCTVR